MPDCTADCSNCNGGGGSYVGNSGLGNIINNCDNPCAKSGVDLSLSNGQPNEIRSLILYRFASVPTATVTFSNHSYPSTTNRDAVTLFDLNGSAMNSNIILNLTALSQRSNEYNFATYLMRCYTPI